MTQVLQAKCPFCQNVLRIPADWLAKPMRCKYCKQVIQAKGAAAPPAPAAAGRSAEEAQAVAAGPPAAVSVAPRRSADPFSFDDAPNPAPVAAPRLRKRSNVGMIVALGLLGLTTAGVVAVVFAWPQLRDLIQGNVPLEEIAQNNGQGGPLEPGATDKGTEPGPRPKKGNAPVKGSKDLFPRRALLINVNNYWVLNPVHYGTTQSAGYPGSSTSVLASRLSNAPMYFPATQVVEVSDSASSPVNPQKSVIEDAVSQFCNTSREQDRIVILFAGHAVEIDKEAYLVPYEGHKDDAKTLIPLAWVYDKLAKCKARQKVFILDAFRFPPARGFELPGTGAMSEDFEAKFHNPPPGVQAWSACVKDQQSIEFDGGSLFLQCVSHALQERLGGFASPEEALPVEILVGKVNQRMKDLLSKTKLEQVTRLSGKEPEGGAAYNAAEPLPPQLAIRPPEPPPGEKAGAALVNNILGEIKQIPPMKASLKAYMTTLKAEAMPAFPQKIMDFYRAEYKSWSELEAMVKKDAEKYALREAVLEAKAALDKAEALTMEENLYGPINDKTKASFLAKQKEPALHIFEMEEALAKLKEAGEKRDKEDNKRWLANYDYTYARLLSRLVYVDEYNYILGDIRGDRLPALEGDASGWRLGFKQKLSTNESKAKNRAKEIGKLWKKIAEEHPNTPWAMLAQRESLYAMGLEWRASRE